MSGLRGTSLQIQMYISLSENTINPMIAISVLEIDISHRHPRDLRFGDPHLPFHPRNP